MRRELSRAAFQKACGLFPGGVNSPVRAFKSVGGDPFVVASGSGARLRDLDGNEYIDYVLSWGPLALGHAHPEVRAAVNAALDRGWSYGALCEGELRLAERVRALVPTMEMMRFVSSGTEAVMGALRLARAATGRDLIVKCDGGYHGHSDGLLVSAGSGLATLGVSSSAGVPAAVAATSVVIPINDAAALERAFANHPGRIAAFILEPVVGNVGLIPPDPGYLEAVRGLCTRHGALLVFDEVLCGFRVALGGAQALYQVKPDITVLGKVIGGGFPVGAYGGARTLMERIAPLGPVYQAGTLSGNPVAMAAGLKTLEILEQGAFARALASAEELERGLCGLLEKNSVSACVQRVGTILTLFFCQGPVRNYADAARADRERYARLHRRMLEAGVYLPPSQFEAAFVSSAHGAGEIAITLEALARSLAAL